MYLLFARDLDYYIGTLFFAIVFGNSNSAFPLTHVFDSRIFSPYAQ